MNVESSHCYGNQEAFFRGVSTILKEDGLFIYSDFRQKGPELERTVELINRYFTIVNHEDIRLNVLQAMNIQDKLKVEEIAKLPWYARNLASGFAGTRGSHMYQEFSAQARTYFAYALKKKESSSADKLD